MKFKKLIIKNIASIADAEIDFDSAPISDADIFLICGDTGTGKSTILDAICLALYGTTPRMANSKSNKKAGGEHQKSETESKFNQIDSIPNNNPCNLLRQGTGEAYARLTFRANDNTEWEAEWYIRRAHKKSDGELQKVKWTLTDSKSKRSISKGKEINDKIEALIGLKFDQFCRTSMLAQGEFTKFLNSNENEKSDILQKIIGADEYSRIGTKIFTIYSQKKRLYEESNTKTEGVKTLSEEEKTAIEKEMDENKRLLEANAEKLNLIEKKRSWLQQDASNRKEIADATERLAKIRSEMEHPDVKKNRKFISNWESTIEVRHDCDDKKKHEVQLSRLISQLETEHDKFESLLADSRRLELLEESRSTKENTAEQRLREMQPLTPLLENASKWIQSISDSIDLRKEILRLEGKEAKLKKEIESKLQPDASAAESAHSAAQSIAKKAAEDRDQIQKGLDSEKLEKDKKLRNAIQKADSSLTLQLAKLDSIEDLKSQYELRGKELEKVKIKVESDKGRLPELKKAKEEWSIRLEAAQHALDLGNLSAEEYSREIRSILKPGDRCPICNHEITSTPDESPFAGLLNAYEREREEAKIKYDAAAKAFTELDSNIKSRESSISKETKRLNADIESLSQKTKELHKEAIASGAEISEENSNLKEWRNSIESLSLQKKEELKEVDIRLEKMERLRKDSEDATRELERSREILRKCVSSLAEKQNLLTIAFTQMKAIAEQITQSESELKAKNEQISHALSEMPLDFDWMEKPTDASEAISKCKKEFEDLTKTCRALKEEKQAIETAATSIQEMKKALKVCIPEWRESQEESSAVEPAFDPGWIKGLSGRATELQTSAIALSERKKEITATLKEIKKEIADYLLKNPEISEDRIAELNKTTSSAISAMKMEWEEKEKELAGLKGSLSILEKQASELYRCKPELAESDTPESLLTNHMQLSEHQRAISERQGSLSHRLLQDEADKKRMASLIAERDERYAMMEKWEKLNNYFGDAQGKKFSKIALSYVLSNLIDNANNYLEMLTDRYTLVCSPGSLVIYIEDRYDGYRRRPCTTISGGESFLVSLALALGLGDIGDKISTDTIFIDEGFGTLSGEPLRKAINTLRSLQSKMNKHVGIISHIGELREKIPVQIRLERTSSQSVSTIDILPHIE